MNPYTVDELKQMLRDAIVEHIQTVDTSKTEEETAQTIPNEIIRAAVITDARVALSLVNAISEVIEKNNQRLLEVIAGR